MRLWAVLGAAFALGCSADPGSVSVAFSWGEGGRPTAPHATLFARVAEPTGDLPLYRTARTIPCPIPSHPMCELVRSWRLAPGC